ncbi:hypothetical protein ACFWF7_39055 [Nocardia sp. NPDC060256]|uniref:hypothetical protein n=1 Tax=unclassified Nocardia TaxID=2637762 RepID=UPI00365166CB
MTNTQLKVMLGMAAAMVIAIIAATFVATIGDDHPAMPGPGLCFPVVTLPPQPDQGQFCRYRP